MAKKCDRVMDVESYRLKVHNDLPSTEAAKIVYCDEPAPHRRSDAFRKGIAVDYCDEHVKEIDAANINFIQHFAPERVAEYKELFDIA